MKNDNAIKNEIMIPEHEVEVIISRSGGPGGQHVNKTSSRVTLRWNVKTTTALSDTEKERVLQKLQAHLTSEGDLLVHNASTRSQLQNKKCAFDDLIKKVRKALYVPKRRMKTVVPKGAQEARIKEKQERSAIKKMRHVKIDD